MINDDADDDDDDDDDERFDSNLALLRLQGRINTTGLGSD